MELWTRSRKISLVVHVFFVSVPFVASTASAFSFWWTLFDSPLLAAVLLGSIEIPALTGYILHIARIPSPFWFLKRLLPFISILPLCWELYQLLAHNGDWIAVPTTVVVAAIFTTISWKCFSTIEHLFLDQKELAKEKAEEAMAEMLGRWEVLEAATGVMDNFVIKYNQQRQLALPTIPREVEPQAQMGTVNTSIPSAEDVSRLFVYSIDDPPSVSSETEEVPEHTYADLPTVTDDNGASWKLTADGKRLFEGKPEQIGSLLKSGINKLNKATESQTPPLPVQRQVKPVTVGRCELDGCDNELTMNDKSVGGRAVWRGRFNGKIACKSCRDSWKEQ